MVVGQTMMKRSQIILTQLVIEAVTSTTRELPYTVMYQVANATLYKH